MQSNTDPIFVAPREMENLFYHILLRHQFTKEKARSCARIFMENSLDGVYSHGVNRFSRFIKYVQEGYVQPNKEAICKNRAGALEQWDGQLGPGPLNAVRCTGRAMVLAREYGMGCVALAHTNHWMRGGTYGWQAAREGFAFIGWTNTLANMPAWGALDPKLGNNPLVLAVPHQLLRGNEATAQAASSQEAEKQAIVLDMAMSQFSYGSLEAKKLSGKPTSVDAGYDMQGRLSQDAGAVLESRRILPAGYWKGAGLSLLLDLLASLLSGGLSTAEISHKQAEHSVSQVYIAFDLSRLHHYASIPEMVRRIIADYHTSTPADPNSPIVHPGQHVRRNREQNSRQGIPVKKAIWDEIQAL